MEFLPNTPVNDHDLYYGTFLLNFTEVKVKETTQKEF